MVYALVFLSFNSIKVRLEQAINATLPFLADISFNSIKVRLEQE